MRSKGSLPARSTASARPSSYGHEPGSRDGGEEADAAAEVGVGRLVANPEVGGQTTHAELLSRNVFEPSECGLDQPRLQSPGRPIRPLRRGDLCT